MRAEKTATKKAAIAPDAVKPAAKTGAKAGGKAALKAAPKGKAAAPVAAVRPPTTNPIKARFLTALLIGPVYQAFEGSPGPRGDSGGLVRAAAGEASAYSQKVFDLVKPVAKASIDLITSGSRQINDRKKDLQDAGRRTSRFPREECTSRPTPGSGGRRFPPCPGRGQMNAVPFGSLACSGAGVLALALCARLPRHARPRKDDHDDRGRKGHAGGQAGLTRVDRICTR